MKYIKFNEDDFVNEQFQMKVLLDMGADVYVTGIFTKYKDEKLEVGIYDYFKDTYTETYVENVRGYWMLE